MSIRRAAAKSCSGALAALGLALLAGASQAAELRFGLSSAGLSYPFAAAIAKGFQDAARRAGAKAVVLDAQGQVQKQANDIDDLIAQKPAGIAIMPLDSTVARAWVDRAAAAGAPVVAVGSAIPPRAGPATSIPSWSPW
jgi:ribose transport system substrate-binding protein